MTACMLAKNYRLGLRTGLGEIFEKLLGIYDEERGKITNSGQAFYRNLETSEGGLGSLVSNRIRSKNM